MTDILEILQAERAVLEGELQEAAREIRQAMSLYTRFGDGSKEWRFWFDRRFRISKRLQEIEAEIKETVNHQNRQFITAI